PPCSHATCCAARTCTACLNDENAAVYCHGLIIFVYNLFVFVLYYLIYGFLIIFLGRVIFYSLVLPCSIAKCCAARSCSACLNDKNALIYYGFGYYLIIIGGLFILFVFMYGGYCVYNAFDINSILGVFGGYVLFVVVANMHRDLRPEETL
ncbi:unnamed protein product, partial [Adineta steineri]